MICPTCHKEIPEGSHFCPYCGTPLDDKCPHCGHQFDYDAETEHTFAQQVLDYAADYQRWITQDIVREEMEKLTPEIRTQVISLIDSVKSEKKEFSQKGLQDLMNYVRCPHCWGKVYRSNAILQNTSEDTTGKNEPSVDTASFI